MLGLGTAFAVAGPAGGALPIDIRRDFKFFAGNHFAAVIRRVDHHDAGEIFAFGVFDAVAAAGLGFNVAGAVPKNLIVELLGAENCCECFVLNEINRR